jgi:hypothetical protein
MAKLTYQFGIFFPLGIQCFLAFLNPFNTSTFCFAAPHPSALGFHFLAIGAVPVQQRDIGCLGFSLF